MGYRTPATTPLPESGSFEEFGFSELVLRAARERKTALLEVRGDSTQKTFQFRNGLICGSRSSAATESLARAVVMRGKVTREVVEALGVNLLDDEKVGAALLQKGLIAPDALEEVLRYQIMLRIADVFARASWTFAWKGPGELPPRVGVNQYQIFSEGVARRVSREQMAAEVTELRDRAALVSPESPLPLDASTLPARARQLLQAMNGRLTFGDLAALGLDRVAPDQRPEGEYRSWVYLLAFVEGGFADAGDAPQVRAPAAAAATPAPESGAETGTITVFSGGTAVEYQEIEDPAFTRRFEEMRQQDHFQLLGLERNATDAQVKKAYFKLAKEFHPDKVYNHSERTVKKYSDKLFALINRAYEELKSAETRASYAARLDELAQGIDIEKEAADLLQSESEFQKGVVLFRKRDYNGALAHLEEALRLNPREADHHIYLGWILFQKSYPADDAGAKRAIDHINKGLEIQPRSVVGHLFLANATKVSGDVDRAELLFRKVLQLQPGHVDAQRELRLIEQRKAKGDAEPPKKIINKLFKQ